MKVKVFQTNSHGKIEFTRAELEKLLNEVYDGGFRDGEVAQREKSTWTWTSPYGYSDNIILTNSTNRTNTIDNYTQPIDKLTCTYDSATNNNNTSIAKNLTTDVAPISVSVNSTDHKAIEKHISHISQMFESIGRTGDVFTNLAKELNF